MTIRLDVLWAVWHCTAAWTDDVEIVDGVAKAPIMWTSPKWSLL